MEPVEVARAFAREVIAPNAARWEEERRYPREAVKAAAARGLCGLVVPEETGGAGLGASAMARVMAVLAGADMAFSFGLVVHNNLAGAIARHGSARQRETYIDDLVEGRRVGAFLLTEPHGGSNAAGIRTRARRDGGDWIIDGEKAWVSNGAEADVLSVYAQTDPDLGWRGIACFLVDADRPGVVREPAYRLMGGHALGAGAFRFEGCRVGGDTLLLGPGDGFKAAMAGIDLARINVAAMCCGMMGVGLDLALAATAERHAFGQAIAEFQGIQWMLADAATDLEASRLLAHEAARRLDAGEDAALAAAHAKKFATRAALTRIADCMQVMGADGLRADCPLARHLACAKIAQYLDGTTEIQNVVISRALRRGAKARIGKDTTP
jgi:alkylation response protein AidB-like acyl-CoA dehydrogenase